MAVLADWITVFLDGSGLNWKNKLAAVANAKTPATYFIAPWALAFWSSVAATQVVDVTTHRNSSIRPDKAEIMAGSIGGEIMPLI
jgi:hypothetical protein